MPEIVAEIVYESIQIDRIILYYISFDVLHNSKVLIA